jgi:hypothetical protein
LPAVSEADTKSLGLGPVSRAAVDFALDLGRNRQIETDLSKAGVRADVDPLRILVMRLDLEHVVLVSLV